MNRILSLNISRKFWLINLFLVLIVGVFVFFYSSRISASEKSITYFSEVYSPTVKSFGDLKVIATRSRMLITNWIDRPRFHQINVDEKEEKFEEIQRNIFEEDQELFKHLHSFEYKAVKESLSSLKNNWQSEEHAEKLQKILVKFEEFMEGQVKIKDLLVLPELYTEQNINEAKNILFTEIVPSYHILYDLISELEHSFIHFHQKEFINVPRFLSQNYWMNYSLLLVVAIFVFIIMFFVDYSILGPIFQYHEVIKQLAKGKVPDVSNVTSNKNELGRMFDSIKTLVKSTSQKISFSNSISEGDYDSQFDSAGKEDELGSSLLRMQGNLKRLAKDANQRTWTNEGVAHFAEILRATTQSIDEFSEQIIVNLVQYVKANQGAIFLIPDREDSYEPYMELMSCYAWDKLKMLEKRVHKGEGLAGQAWLEESTIFMTDVPKDYIEITSGLGHATPKCILIVPLIANQQIFGVLEIASFKILEEYEVKFISRIADNYAATISTVRTNEKTKRLLEESTEMTEQLRSHEEEMRQSMEELQATQEEMQKFQRDIKQKDKVLNATTLIVETDLDLYITHINQHSYDYLKYEKHEVVGRPLSKLFKTHEVYKDLREAITKNSFFDVITYMTKKDRTELLVKVSAAPFFDKYDRLEKYVIIIDNITEAKRFLELNSILGK